MRTVTGGDAPLIIVSGGKHGRGATRYTGTKLLEGTKKLTRLTSKYVLRGETKKEKIIIRQFK